MTSFFRGRHAQMAPNHLSAAAYLERGNRQIASRDWAGAVACFRDGLQYHQADIELRIGLGIARLGASDFDGAIAELRASVTANPSHFRALQHLASAFTILGRRTQAASTWAALGSALESSGRHEEAYDVYSSALTHDPKCVRALVGLAEGHLKRGEPHKAALRLEAALALDYERVSAHVLLSQAYHLMGDYTRGLQEFAWLTHPRVLQWRGFDQPLWDGSSLTAQTILLWVRPGSGLGDAIQFLRYAPLVHALGARVAVECHPELVPIAEQMPGVSIALAKGEALPRFDVHLPLPRLPVVLRDAPWPLPMSRPYISAPAAMVQCWRNNLGSRDRPIVGVAWGGNPRRPDASIRFAPLRALAPLSRLPGVRLINLQVEPQVAELANPPEGLHIEHTPIHMNTPLQEKAALIASLDLVVTVDTMVAHLAGAMGKPVWTVLPFASDWRWLQGDATPWYPTMRLFRQTTRGDWIGVMERVTAALSERVWT
jgi:hypothetical protein